MRIGISGFFLNHPATGSGQYTLGLLRAMAGLCGDDITLFCSPQAAPILEELGSLPIQVVWLPKALAGDMSKLWFEQVALPWACRRYGIELLHVPYLGPPLWSPCKLVVTVHDLVMLLLPQHRGSPLVRLYSTLVCAATQRADLILADSYCTKRDIIRLLKVAEERIQVVYLACEEHFQPNLDGQHCQEVRDRYGLKGNYVLYLGGTEWRKNLPLLLRAFARLGGDAELVIAAEPHPARGWLFPDLGAEIRRLHLEGRARFLGFVAEADKPALYATASLFVFPSLYEGFGLPPLEAMACGTPVLSSRAASLPELVGDGGLLFDPRDEAELARLMGAVLDNGALRRELRERALERVRCFSWRTTAEKTLEAYREAVERAQ